MDRHNANPDDLSRTGMAPRTNPPRLFCPFAEMGLGPFCPFAACLIHSPPPPQLAFPAAKPNWQPIESSPDQDSAIQDSPAAEYTSSGLLVNFPSHMILKGGKPITLSPRTAQPAVPVHPSFDAARSDHDPGQRPVYDHIPAFDFSSTLASDHNDFVPMARTERSRGYPRRPALTRSNADDVVPMVRTKRSPGHPRRPADIAPSTDEDIVPMVRTTRSPGYPRVPPAITIRGVVSGTISSSIRTSPRIASSNALVSTMEPLAEDSDEDDYVPMTRTQRSLGHARRPSIITRAGVIRDPIPSFNTAPRIVSAEAKVSVMETVLEASQEEDEDAGSDLPYLRLKDESSNDTAVEMNTPDLSTWGSHSTFVCFVTPPTPQLLPVAIIDSARSSFDLSGGDSYAPANIPRQLFSIDTGGWCHLPAPSIQTLEDQSPTSEKARTRLHRFPDHGRFTTVHDRDAIKLKSFMNISKAVKRVMRKLCA